MQKRPRKNQIWKVVGFTEIARGSFHFQIINAEEIRCWYFEFLSDQNFLVFGHKEYTYLLTKNTDVKNKNTKKFLIEFTTNKLE